MEDESSSKAVTLLPETHATALSHPNTTHPPPQATKSTETYSTFPHRSSAETPLLEAPVLLSSAYTAAVRHCESDSNEEEAPLFQHPLVSTPSATAQPLQSWCGVSATPPSSVLHDMMIADTANAHHGGVGGLLPTPVLHGEWASTPAGQSIPVGQDFSNHYSPTSNTKPRAAGTGAAASAALSAVRPVVPTAYVDRSSSESLLGVSLGGIGRTGSLNGVGHPGGAVLGAHRSLFCSMTSANGGAQAAPLAGPSRRGQQQQQQRKGITDNSNNNTNSVPSTAVSTPMPPSCAGVGGGDAVIVTEPPPPTPVKQRRTIHTTAAQGTQRNHSSAVSGGSSGSGSYASFGPRLSMNTNTTAATAVRSTTNTNSYSNLSIGATSPLKLSSRTVAPLRLPPTSPSLPQATTPSTMGNNNSTFTLGVAPSLSFKFHKREGNRKRSADVLSQFSALDLDETPVTPYGQTMMGGRFNSLGGANGLPSQHSASLAAMRGGGYNNNTNNNGSAMFGPTSPLMGGYTTPTTLSLQIVGSNTFSQMLLHPSQDVLETSQADTECSNFLARRIVNDYNEVRLLGRGSFGTVSLYKEISSGDYVAVKVSPPLRAPDMERRYRRERSIMGMVRGMPHIVQLSAAWEEGRVPRMYLQLEYCPGGSLAALATAKQSRNEAWLEEEVKVFLVQMSIALDALHRANIAHVDFKPDNVLLDKDGAYKLSDFGCSVLLDDNGRPRAETRNGYGGTISSKTSGKGQSLQQEHQHKSSQNGGGNYSSPSGNKDAAVAASAAESVGACVADFSWNELNETSTASVDEGDCRYLCADMLNEKKYFKAGDMFSLGMSLYELMSGQPLPRNGDQFLALRRQVPVEQLRRRGYSVALVKLVAALLHADPAQRPTARQVLQYLRPSPAELQLLADTSAIQQWTASAESFTALSGQQQQQSSERGVRLHVSMSALRCVSAMMEGSCWLLTTTQQDVYHVLAKTGDEGAEQDQHRQQQQQQRLTLPCPPLPSQLSRPGNDLEVELDDMPMSPILREEACTPTTLNY